MSMQLNLFDHESTERHSSLLTPRHLNRGISGKLGVQNADSVPGLHFVEGFLTPEEQAYCVQRIDAAQDEWRNDLSRRVQHYGWRYDYKARAITPDMHLGALPGWLANVAQRLYDETGLFDRAPEQVIVNEYLPGQGIATHIDHRGFGPTVCMVSLLDDWEMDFSKDWKNKNPALLKQGSVVLLDGPARDTWQHGIAPRRSEPTESGRRDRKRRLSMTFRTVLNHDGAND